jgi:hypothetical protein
MRIVSEPNYHIDQSINSIQVRVIQENNDPDDPTLQLFTEIAYMLRSRLLQIIRNQENNGFPLATENDITGIPNKLK